MGLGEVRTEYLNVQCLWQVDVTSLNWMTTDSRASFLF